MSLDTWFAFVIACTVLTLIPGPSVLLVIGQSLTRGRKAALLCIVGDMIGGIVLMGLSFIGVGAILATSAALFQAVKWAGVLYLAWLGYQQIAQARLATDEAVDTQPASSHLGSLWAGAITAILNPKAIVFYLAFLSQFVDPARDMVLQVAVLISTSTVVVAILLTVYAFVAARTFNAFQSKRAKQRVGYAGGTCMIGGSVLMAATR